MKKNDLPKVPDLQDKSHAEIVLILADNYLKTGKDPDGLKELETVYKEQSKSLTEQLALKLAISKAVLQRHKKPVNVSVVFAIYKETSRMKTRDEHPHGEDFLIRKVEQLNWLAEGTTLQWNLVVVDDGCPDYSGKMTAQILKDRAPGEEAVVLHLEDAIKSQLTVTRGLKSTDDSRKGGSILFGMWYAAQKQRENHYIIFTDADLSTHLGQCGLLLEPMLADGKPATIGSRREPNSVVIKGSSRSDRGRLFIHLWKSMIPQLGRIIDTQCGFKGFKADLIDDIVLGNIEKKFAFDIELLLRLEKRKKGSVAKRGIAWIDSEAASTTKDLQPYLSMLKSVAAMSRYYLHREDKTDKLIELINDMSEDHWNKLLESIPEKIITEPIEKMGDPSLTSVEDLRERAGIPTR